jgi:Domain of unknown function (DUF4157)
MRVLTPRAASPTVTEKQPDLGLRPGVSLSSDERSFFDSRFGHDFSRVRVHADGPAAALASGFGARAVTAGNDIAFAAGEFAPHTPKGFRILAHELAHVAQQQHAPQRHSLPWLSAPTDRAERQADVAADAVLRGGSLPALGPPGALVHRACGEAALGAPPACESSRSGVVGWPFQFQPGCDDLVAGEESNLTRIRHHSRLNIHGYASASADGPAGFLESLSCHRANKLATLARRARTDCRVGGIFAHGASDRALGAVGLIEQIRDVNVWLDPSGNLSQIRAELDSARANPAAADLNALAARRPQIRTWLNDVPTNVAPAGIQLDRADLDNYRNFYALAEGTWRRIDALLATQSHPAAGTDTYQAWAVGPGGTNQGSAFHIQQALPPAFLHVDIFGEGHFPGAINLGMATRTSTTGINDSRVPNAIFRRFSSNAAQNGLPIADHTVDLVTAENGPIGLPGLAAEIARILAPGGTVILYNPEGQEPHHDAVAAAIGGTVTKTRRDGILETRIVAPAPPPRP